MSTQTKKLSESTVVQSIAEADKIPIVNSSGQTVLVPLSGLLGAVKVGGRNLVKGSDRTSGSASGASYDYGWKSLTELPADGEEVTLSFECSSDITGIMIRLVNVGDIRLSGNTKQASNGRYYITGKWANPVTLNGCSMYVSAAGLSIRRIKVERGNIPTDWSPAPEDWEGVKTSLSAVCAFAAQLSKQKGGSQHEPNEGADKRRAQGNTPGCYDVSRGCGVSGKLYPGGILLNQFRHYIHQSTQYPGLAVRNPGSLIARRRSDTTHNEHLCRLHNRQSISARLLAAVAPNCHDRDIAARKEVAV